MRVGARRWSLVDGVVLTAMAAAVGGGALVIAGPSARNDPLPKKAAVAVIAMSHNIRADSSLDAIARGRLYTAMHLVRAGHAPRLITTRVQNAQTTSDSGQAQLIRLAGLERQWSIAPGVLNNTREEALAVRAILPESSAVIVVSSPSHTRRACATFERVGFVVTCVASANRSSKQRVVYERLYERLAMWKYRYDDWVE